MKKQLYQNKLEDILSKNSRFVKHVIIIFFFHGRNIFPKDDKAFFAYSKLSSKAR